VQSCMSFGSGIPLRLGNVVVHPVLPDGPSARPGLLCHDVVDPVGHLT
jgi:hypothetical protein